MGKIMTAVKQMSSVLNCWEDIVRKWKFKKKERVGSE